MPNHQEFFTHPEMDEPFEGVTYDEFMSHWNPRGANQAWLRLGRVARQHTDFPLRNVEENPDILLGDVGAALAWITHDSTSGLRVSTTRPILEKILQSREERSAS